MGDMYGGVKRLLASHNIFGSGEEICFPVKDMFRGDQICLVMPHNKFGGG